MGSRGSAVLVTTIPSRGVLGPLDSSFLLLHRALCALFWAYSTSQYYHSAGEWDFLLISADPMEVFPLPGPHGLPLAMRPLGSARNVSLSLSLL